MLLQPLMAETNILESHGMLLLHGALAVLAVLAAQGVCILLSFKLNLYNKKTSVLLDQKDIAWSVRLDCADDLFGQCFYPVLAYLAVSGSLQLSGDVNSRWFEVTTESYVFQLLYVVRMVLHMPVQCITLADKPSLLAQMTAHHALSAVCFGGSLVTGRMHFWALLDGSCEVTTVALNTLFLVQGCCPPGWFQRTTKLASGICLFFSFLVFRIALFPAWLWYFYVDVTSEPEVTWERVTWVERLLYPSVTAGLFVLSCLWMIPITKLVLRGIGLVKEREDTKTEKEE